RSFAATLGFSVDEATAEAAARLAPLAGSSAPERLAEELRHIFSMQDSADAVRMMRDNRLLENILPETKGQLDISMTRYAAIETAIAAFMQMSEDKDMTALMNITRPYVIFSLKYAALMPDVRAAAQSAASLRLSNTETELITFFTGIRSEILTTFRKLPEQPAETEIIRIILAAGGSPVGACMSALAQLQAEEGAERTAEFIKFSGAVAGYFQDVFIPRAALLPLITGEEIMDRFGLAQSPLVGECLKHIGNLVILGLVSTKSEALKAVEDLISSKNAS
ncbi:MAG: hypothetical protein LLF86_02305, partial [Nitrospiraceae bacterium]|nr:hypothetical protein [Nitrospiraceae bacterium]